MNTLHFLVVGLFGVPVQFKQLETITYVIGQSCRVGPLLFPNTYLQSHFLKIARFSGRARAVPNIVEKGHVHTLLQFRRSRMQRKQSPCDGQPGLKPVGQWAKASAAVLLVAILVSLSGCHKHVVFVDVPVKAKFTPSGNIKEFDVHNFDGPAECAKDLQEGIRARAANAGDFTMTIPGLPDLDGPLEVRGRVDTCSTRMGYGVLNATMMLSHGGKQLYQEIVREETNRPGASIEEVRTILVDRAINRFVAIFVTGKKSEMREVRPHGGSDPGWVAAQAKNWRLAIESWSKRISGEPTDHQAWYNRGIAHEGLWEFREAAADYKKAVELERDELYMQALVRVEKIVQDITAIEAAKKSRE